MAGKGDTYRPVNRKIYNENYDHIFRKSNIVVDENNLDKILKLLLERYNYRIAKWDKHEVHFRIGLKRPDGTLVEGWGTDDNGFWTRNSLKESCQNAVNELRLKDEEF